MRAPRSWKRCFPIKSGAGNFNQEIAVIHQHQQPTATGRRAHSGDGTIAGRSLRRRLLGAEVIKIEPPEIGGMSEEEIAGLQADGVL